MVQACMGSRKHHEMRVFVLVHLSVIVLLTSVDFWVSLKILTASVDFLQLVAICTRGRSCLNLLKLGFGLRGAVHELIILRLLLIFVLTPWLDLYWDITWSHA